MPAQATVNSKLAVYVESPILAAFISFAVGTIALFVYISLTGISLGNLASSKMRCLSCGLVDFWAHFSCR